MITSKKYSPYDFHGRLTSAQYAEGFNLSSTPQYDYSDSVVYNPNSAITHLRRMGKSLQGGACIDNVSFTYSGNQLSAAQDTGISASMMGDAFHFVDGDDYYSEYSYDGCGALTSDSNKGVYKILYDFNGMPTCVWFDNGSITDYVYTADGVKLKTIHRTAVPGIVPSGSTPSLSEQNTLSKDSTLYVGALEVESNIKEKYYYANGFMEIMVGSLSTYNYYTTDHLGNVRHVSRSTPSGNGSIIQVNNYYPFGGLLKEGEHHWDIQNKLYNGKEYDRMQGLNLYDYSARQYDPAICQFTSMDPLCEKYYHISPYAYCGGNPVKYVDPDGRDRYEFDRLGYVTIYEDKEKDILVVNNERVKLNSKGEELKELQLPYGTIQANISGEKDGYALLAINGDENGMKVFEFLAGATDAEWSQAKTGENSNGINYLTSSHQIDMEDGMGVFLFHNSPSISTIRELSHSHPNNHPNPSGIEPMKEDGVCVKKAGDWGDVKFAKDVLKIYPNIHQFRIFTPTTGIWHDWNKYIK